MSKANDAKIDKKVRGSRFPFVSPIFNVRKYFIIIICIFSCSFIFAKNKTYTKDDISVVMANIFDYHIEYKKLDVKMTQRVIKYYLDQFDSDKMFLLESEAAIFLNISDRQAKEIIKRINRNDFSDFEYYNKIIAKSVKRARDIRLKIKKSIVNNVSTYKLKSYDKSSYAKNTNELVRRHKDHFLRFYTFQSKRIKIDTIERKNKVFDLYNRKMVRIEKDFLLSKSQAENHHFLAVHFLKAFSKSLDAHTYFFSDDEAREMRVSLEKNFEGVGVVLSETIDGVIIADLIKNSPAKESRKISPGDVLVEINSVNVEKESFDDVLKAMKKRANGYIQLGLRSKDSRGIVRVSLKARPISMDDDRLTYSHEKYGDGIIGKLDLKSFYENQDGVSSEKDIRRAITNLRKEGELKGVVLDLRENAGGFLSQAIKVAGLFMSNGVVVMSKYSNGDVKYLRTLEGTPFYNGPLIILTSKMSASAAEIVAQALQDYGVGIVVGDQRTFGKGSIQYQTVTNENADYYFKVTIGRYYTVSGRSTQINGVIADIVVPTHYTSYEVGEKYLENSLPPDTIQSAYKDPLSDLEPKIKRLFQRSYLPAVQKVIVYWKNMLPILLENSKQRLATNQNFKVFLKQQEQIKAKLQGVHIDIGENSRKLEDVQMIEAVNIVRDMIMLEAQSKAALEERFIKSKK